MAADEALLVTKPPPHERNEWGTKLLLIVWLVAFLGAATADYALQRRTGLRSLGLSTAVLVGGVTGAQWAQRRGSRWIGFAVAVGIVAASALLAWLVQQLSR